MATAPVGVRGGERGGERGGKRVGGDLDLEIRLHVREMRRGAKVIREAEGVVVRRVLLHLVIRGLVGRLVGIRWDPVG